MTPLSENVALIAAAGSRKTQHIIDQVRANPSQRALVTTYTTENLTQITARLSHGTGTLPSNVTAEGWFTFLLNQCARPYQSYVLNAVGAMRGLNFTGERRPYIPKTQPRRYFLDGQWDVYRNHLSEFAVLANQQSGGKVIDRLAAMYDRIYIDEVQDLVAYDLELLDLLLKSPIAVTLVGDPRQFIIQTNQNGKNRAYKGNGIVAWLEKHPARCRVEHRSESYRCNQSICDFADSLFPELPATKSHNYEITGHDGIHHIRRRDVHDYVEQWSPQVLRYQKTSDTLGLDALNFGMSKGSTYDRVLIFPTQPMLKFLRTGNPADAGSRERLYVAVTRARYSVAFVVP